MGFKKSDKKIINAWGMYDWANSVYSLVITSTIFPIYFVSVTKNDGSDIVSFLGFDFVNTALYSYALSFAFLVIAFVAPLLSAIADYSGNKKLFMKIFCYLGAVSCSTLYFFTGENLLLGIGAFVLAAIGFTGSIVFYNAYLPEIAEEKDQDRVSAKGFALGYIGSIILLIFNLVMIQKPELFGITNSSFPARFSFLLVGVWWIAFAQIPFHYLPKNVFGRKPKGNLLFKGYKELLMVWNQLRNYNMLKIFLAAFFFYTIGVQTVMYMAASFGSKELELSQTILITTILVIQLVAIGGAYLFSKFSAIWGNIKALSIAVILWILICIGAYFVYDAKEFIIVAASVGLVMGGIQSLSRSTYSKMLPETHDHASFFSFFDVTEKIAIVIGTALFGLVEQITGSMRNSLFALTLFFIIGLVFLLKVKSDKTNPLSNK